MLARMLECAAISFSKGSYWHRDQTGIFCSSCIADGFFTTEPPEVKWNESHPAVSNSLQPHGLHSPWNSPGQNTGLGSLSLLQRIFPSQGSNPGPPICREILYQLSHKPPGRPINDTRNTQFSSVQFSHSVMSDSLQPHELQHTRPHCP